MEKNINKIQLEDELVANVAGGKVRIVANPLDGYYVYCESNPDVKYSYKNPSKVAAYMNKYGNLNDEVGLIKYLMDEKLIWIS